MGFESFLGVNPWTALFTLANTVALFLVAKKYLFVPIMKMVEARQKEIDDLYADAGAAREKALAMESEYKAKLTAANDTSERLVKEAVARGQARQEEIILNAKREASAILDRASSDIALEKKKAVSEAKEEISGIAIVLAEKVIGKSLKNADHAELVDSFINELGDQV